MPFAEPQNNLRQLNLKPGDRVADLGAGSGAYTLLAAQMVAPEGRVLAVDIQKDLLQKLKTEANRQNLSNNLDIVWGDIERVGGTGLTDENVDAVILSNILFQTKSRYTAVQETKRILKKGGRVMVIDWTDSFGGLGPVPADLATKEEVQKLFADAGLKLEREFSAGEHHYGLIFIKDSFAQK